MQSFFHLTGRQAKSMLWTAGVASMIIPLGSLSSFGGASPFANYALGDGGGDFVEPQLWVFGNQSSPERSLPLGGQGVRSILDLRHSSRDAALSLMERYVRFDQGMTITLRWVVPHGPGEHLTGKNDFDTPPDSAERARALHLLADVMSSDVAKQLEGRLFIQFYNEVGGGPGKFSTEDAPALLDFATEAAEVIRTVSPTVKICGPAVTMSQILAEDSNKERRRHQERAKVLEDCIKWSAEHADVIDLHLHGEDGSNVPTAVARLRDELQQHRGGEDVDIVSWEWSPAKLPVQEYDDNLRNAIIGLWAAMSRNGITHAAYGGYFPSKRRTESNKEMYWTSIVDENHVPREPIYTTLSDIGFQRIDFERDNDDDSGNEGDGGGRGLSDGDDNGQGDTDVSIVGGASLWIDDTVDSTDELATLGAAGMRQSVDLRTASNKVLKSAIKQNRKSEFGVVMTLRWSDPDNPAQFDQAPTMREHTSMLTKLQKTLKSKDAQTVGTNGLWVQFFDEVAGSQGRIVESEADGLFDFATQMTTTIRSSAPHVKVCGPALTGTSVLTSSNRTADEQARFEVLVRAIDWSIENADAIDVRLDENESVDVAIARLREFLDTREGGADLEIVCWSWNLASAASGPSQTDQRIRDRWDELVQSGVRHAAYGPFSANSDSDSSNDSFALVDEAGQPTAIVGATFLAIAEQIGQYEVEPEPVESEQDRKKRMNQFKKDYKSQLMVDYKASGEKDWKKQWNTDWKGSWESAWEAQEDTE